MPRSTTNERQSETNEADIDSLEITVAANTSAAAAASSAASGAATTANAAATKLTNVSQAQLDRLNVSSAGSVEASKVATYDGSSVLKAATFAESANNGRFATNDQGHVLTRGIYVDANQGDGTTSVPLHGALNMPTTRTFLYTDNKRLRLVNTDADAAVLTTSSSEFTTLQSDATNAQDTADACLPLAGGTLSGNTTINATLTVSGATTLASTTVSDLTTTGDATLGNASTDTATVNGTLAIPGPNHSSLG